MPRDIKKYFTQKDVATSYSSIYHPAHNFQMESCKVIVRRSIQLARKSRNFLVEACEHVLWDVLLWLGSFYGVRRQVPSL